MNTRNVINLAESVAERPLFGLENICLIQESNRPRIKKQTTKVATRKDGPSIILKNIFQITMSRLGLFINGSKVSFR